MLGLKKTSPIEFRLGTSTFWQKKSSVFMYRYFKPNFFNFCQNSIRSALQVVRQAQYKRYSPIKYTRVLKQHHIFKFSVATLSSFRTLFPTGIFLEKKPKILRKRVFGKIYRTENPIKYLNHIFWKKRKFHSKRYAGAGLTASFTTFKASLQCKTELLLMLEWLQLKLKKMFWSTNFIRAIIWGIHEKTISASMIIFKRAIERTWKHKQVLEAFQLIWQTIYSGHRNLLGYKIHLSGTIGHHGRAKIETYTEGSTRLSSIVTTTMFDDISILTPYGNIGAKIWLELLKHQNLPESLRENINSNKLN